jgi:uncharacterized protein with PIN domain
MGLFEKKEPEAYEIQDRVVRCSHCGNGLFWVKRAQLNSSVSTFFNVDWADQSATCLICSECSCIHWFLA